MKKSTYKVIAICFSICLIIIIISLFYTREDQVLLSDNKIINENKTLTVTKNRFRPRA